MFPFALRLNVAGWMHLAYYGAFLPIVVFVSRKKVVATDRPLPNRLRHFQFTAFELTAFAAVSLFIARIQWIRLFPRSLPSIGAILAGVLVLAVQLVYMWPRWRRAVQAKSRVVHLFMPSNATERAWWLVVALVAGIGEEITWRGVQWALLANLTRSYAVAALLCALMFGVVHMVQGWRAVIVIVGFALSFHLLVWLAGSLYVAMTVHVIYDVIAGLMYGRLGRELGYGASNEQPLDVSS
ncbi:MAG TPA: CPBP family glutamic-type intramembrane protease [Thermoanaerobaculia bacterium]|nr:CPBP family glutamic-type intramembrane protease [Thermoanaerobaculia bacterium]